MQSAIGATIASPFPADTNLSPASPVPITLTLTRPFSAIIGCESSLPASLFIKNAGCSDTTPKTLFDFTSLHLVTSFEPPNSTTSPTCNGTSAA